MTVYTIVDNGFCVNPTGTTSSLLGQAHDGSASAFRAGLHVDNGAILETNFTTSGGPEGVRTRPRR